MKANKMLSLQIKNAKPNKNFKSNPELIEKNLQDLLNDPNFQAVMEDLSDK